MWNAVKDRRKHQHFWGEEPEKRPTFSAAGMVRFNKGKKVHPWVATNPNLPRHFTPSEEDKRLAIIDVILEPCNPGEELFDDLVNKL